MPKGNRVRARIDPLIQLAMIERQEPGRLASLMRAMGPEPLENYTQRAHIVSSIDLKDRAIMKRYARDRS